MSVEALEATHTYLSKDLASVALHEATLLEDVEAIQKCLRDQGEWLGIEGEVRLWTNCFVRQPEDVKARYFREGVGRLMRPSCEAAEILLPEMIKYKPLGFEAWLCKQLEHENDDIQIKAIEAMQDVGGLESIKALKDFLDPKKTQGGQARELATFHVRYAAKQALKTIYERLGKNIGELALVEGGLEGALSEVEEAQAVEVMKKARGIRG